MINLVEQRNKQDAFAERDLYEAEAEFIEAVDALDAATERVRKANERLDAAMAYFGGEEE